MGPKARSTVLTEAEAAIVVEFRRRTLLPLDDVMGCLRDAIPKLTQSSLHRCLVRHGISRFPKDEDASSKRQTFKETKIGYVHIDSAQLCSAEGKTHMFLAIDRVSKFVHAEFHATAEMATGAQFMRGVVAACPCQIHTVLTGNGVAFTKNASTKWDGMRHVFDRVCDEHDIEHRLTKALAQFRVRRMEDLRESGNLEVAHLYALARDKLDEFKEDRPKIHLSRTK